MKKFFSLVLALVMALSLTTVAWGAESVANFDELKAAITAGKTDIEVTGKIILSEDLSLTNVTINTGSVEDAFEVGTGYTLTLGAGVTINAANSILYAKGGTVNINGATLKSTSTVNALGFVDNGGTINMNSGSVTAYWTGLTASGDGSKVNIFDGTVESTNSNATLAKNKGTTTITGGTIKSGDDFATLWAKADGVLIVNGDAVISSETGAAISVESATATVSAGTFSGHLSATGTGTIEITGGTFEVAPDAAYLNGLTTVQDTNGNYVVTAPVTFGDKYDLYLANVGMQTALKNKTPSVPGLSFEEVDAKKNLDGSGRVAYIAANNGQFFVKTTNPTVADYAVTYAGKTDVLYYVKLSTAVSPDAFYYTEEVKAFTNWGMKCGQINNSTWTTAQKAEDYFMASDFNVYMAVAATSDENTNYLLDGVVVGRSLVGPTIDHHFVASNFKYDAATGANVPTSALCTTCTQTTTAIYKIGKAPANAVVKPLYVEGRVSDVWEVVPVATSAGGAVSVPSTDKVTSAETFDAGIAMYVGMSVMAAAGSAVVIGKKKD